MLLISLEKVIIFNENHEPNRGVRSILRRLFDLFHALCEVKYLVSHHVLSFKLAYLNISLALNLKLTITTA